MLDRGGWYDGPKSPEWATQMLETGTAATYIVYKGSLYLCLILKLQDTLSPEHHRAKTQDA